MSDELALESDLDDESDETEIASEEEEEVEEREVDDATDNVGDPSVEINVQDLIQELENQGFASKLDREMETRRRLEELMERRRARRDLEDFEDYDI
jgi:hypothetical protein